ncbi:glycine cleavage system aminomethyltransferase GcvT [Stenotrophobium rhamnosiphilum]|uniref:Aminomethyltransferase n=1 Tax=Stenotrophobium rhamnosiphilum TaxID=2029166 RepID=A0A2T5MKX4_9GAMM|nr:glycine cleavage system aminomethyltransferase GcvT [Stenotrophobium rhamnosiphilum]PTU33227.1 glycine cleavage system aminomethyltransferase GcvT [Stenotrophobium rhamnosiphilum]
MLKKTALHAEHVRLGARLVDFAGWEMPIQYQSQLDEHHAVRAGAGMFDVAHMSAVDLHGPRTREFLRKLLANDVAKLTAPGKALYSCMLREDAGIIDDLIAYFINEDWFRLVVNAGTTEKDLAWISQQAAAFGVSVKYRDDLGIVAVQGPEARDKVIKQLPSELAAAAQAVGVFQAVYAGDWFVGRTGYTGEDGFELMLPHADLVKLWQKLEADGVRACGLGARDTLRLEAGMNLYGQDMDESKHPLESGLGWTIGWDPADRDFIGRTALSALRGKSPQKFVSLVLEGRGVVRAHMKVRFANGAEGETTSGGFAPTMKSSIAFARVDAKAEGACEVEIRGQWVAAKLVKAPFVRNGKVLV